MAYIGKQPEIDGDATDIIVDTITGNGSTTTMTVSSVLAPASVNNISVFVAGLMQVPGTDYTLSSKTITFTTAPANGLKVVAISHVDTFSSAYANAFATGHGNLSIKDASVTNDHIDSMTSSKLTGTLPAGSGANLTNLTAGNLTGTVADARISTLTASKLSGALPALNASNLTGIVATSVTKNSGDPAVTTNPSGGVGTLWSNSTSGEAFVCTDATTNRNVWTNIGAGSGDVKPYSFQGEISGYVSSTNDIGNGDIIDKFSLVSDANATDVGDLTVKRLNGAGGKSATHGYHAGGYTGVEYSSNIIDKYTFAADNDATDVGDLTVGRSYNNGQSSSTHCYATGGAATWHANSESDVIDKWTTSADANATDVGNLAFARQQNTAGQSSTTHGYTCGGTHPPGATYTDAIEKFTFATDNNATDHGDMTTARNQAAGQSSTTHGYITGGYSPNTDNIEKFAFASNVTAADQGDLTVGNRWSISGQSSTTHGYTSGGYNGSAVLNIIDKHAFANNNNATDVGDLTVARNQTAGSQN